MEKTNKQIIQELIDYLMAQDKKVVCRVLANMMIDFNRIDTIDSLPDIEKSNLKIRIINNAQAVRDFAFNGPKGNLSCGQLDDN